MFPQPVGEVTLVDLGDPGDPVVMMRSQMTIEATDARFAFLFLPRISAIEAVLSSLGLGREAA